MDSSVKSYVEALSAYYPFLSHITYAGKAFLCKAIAAWAQTHDEDAVRCLDARRLQD